MKKVMLTLFLLALIIPAFSAVQVNYMYSRFAGCDNSGVIAVYGSGGNGTYTYKWSTGSTGGPAAADSITSLQAGTYWVTCYSGADSAKRSFQIYPFGVDTIYRFHACHGGYGRINISYLQATWPVHTQWYLNGDSLAHDEFELDSLHGGLYTLYLVDAKGCELRDTIKLGESSPVFNVYTNDTVVCYNEWGTFWFTPGFTLIYEDYFYGSSNDTLYPFNTLYYGLDFPVCAMDSEGCVACDDTLPEIYVGGHPQSFYMRQSGDTVYLEYLNVQYDSIYTYGWNTPHGYEVTHYNFYIADTTGNYYVGKINEYGCSIGSAGRYVTYTDISGPGVTTELIQLTPNPASGETLATVPLSDIGKTIQLFDLYGKLLTESVVQQTKFRIQLHQYPAGIYFVKIGEQTIRLVKQ